ncbi:MAG: amino acid permease [Candidatus Omnitrophica bacterium]|nr:amino acid permease [Candidatus Omnitrophota bacterium]
MKTITETDEPEEIGCGGPPLSLRRSLGLVDATALVIGCVIGAGIFRAAASVAAQLHTPGLVMAVWAVGGILSFCGALCYAELGAAYPKAGGDYVYLTRAYGPAVGFLFGWTKVFTERIGTIAILGFVFAEYAGSLAALNPAQTKWFAALAILLLTGANVIGIQVGKEVQNLLTGIKLFALLGIIAVGLLSGKAQPVILSLGTDPIDGGVLRAFGVALVFVLWTYGGWAESTYVAEEVRRPERTLPWSIFLGLGVVTLLYLVVNWVYMAYIPLNQMPGRPLVAAEVMRSILGPVGAKVTAGMVAASAFGALNGFILTSSRILLAVGRDHPIFGRLSKVSPRFATPVYSLIFNAVGALVLVWAGTFDQIVTYSTVAISVFSGMAALGVILLRIKEPLAPRPYRVWGYPLTPLIFVLGLFLFIGDVALMQPKETLFGFGLMLLGLPLYAGSRRLQKSQG